MIELTGYMSNIIIRFNQLALGAKSKVKFIRKILTLIQTKYDHEKSFEELLDKDNIKVYYTRTTNY